MAERSLPAWIRNLTFTVGFAFATSAPAQVVTFATHDWNVMSGGNWERDTWADVKTPGDGRVYSVGTTVVRNPLAGLGQTPFSGRPATYLVPTFGNALTQLTKQVAILQIAKPGSPAGIEKQAYFFGINSNLQGAVGAPNYTRAVSVWPGALPAETRIAICGATRDPELPLGQGQPPQPRNASANHQHGQPPFSGFIAVLDGDLTLKWTYHFYASDASTATTITDVSIRVERDENQQLREYVTYCGATLNGNPGVSLASTMLPVRPFQSPGTYLGDVYAAGDSDNGNGTFSQWDGIVGRVSSPANLPTPSLDFHSLVGGSGNDVLLGLAQRTRDDFIVVGTIASAGPSAPGQLAFPLTNSSVFAGGPVEFASLSGASQFGVVMEFMAPQMAVPACASTTTSGCLQLVSSRLLGATGTSTIARDVIWQAPPAGNDWIYIVGSTNFSGLAAAFPSQAVGALVGLSSGILVSTSALALTGPGPWLAGKYIEPLGSASSSGATGVAAWNEYYDHLTVAGWVTHPSGETRVMVTNFFREPGFGTAGWQGLSAIHRIACDGASVGNQRSDLPGAMGDGPFSAYQELAAFPSNSFLGPIASGGVAVDRAGLVSVVGSTSLAPGSPPAGYPIVGPPAETRQAEGTNQLVPQVDALRLGLEMLPLGVWYDADGGSGPGPSYVTVGGTTPACALSAFGNIPTPAVLSRMFLDMDGVPGPGATVDILVDRPISGALAISGLWFGFPQPTPSPFPGIQLYGDINTAVIWVAAPSDESWRLRLNTMPQGSATFTVQFVNLLLPWNYCTLAPGCATQTGCLANQAFNSVASGALWIQY